MWWIVVLFKQPFMTELQFLYLFVHIVLANVLILIKIHATLNLVKTFKMIPVPQVATQPHSVMDPPLNLNVGRIFFWWNAAFFFGRIQHYFLLNELPLIIIK